MLPKKVTKKMDPEMKEVLYTKFSKLKDFALG